MKKILFLVKHINMAGTEMGIYSLIKKLSDYDITVGYIYEVLSNEMLEKLKKYSNVKKIDKEYETDILIYCDYGFSEIYDLKSIKRKKTIHWNHYFGREERSIFYDEDYINSLDKVICVSKSSKDIMQEKIYYKKIKDKVDIIQNVIDSDEIKVKSNIPTDINFEDGLNIVTVARISKAKGFERMAKLANSMVTNNIKFNWYIIGQASNSKEEAEIMNIFKPLMNNFKFLGKRENPYNIINKCDYLVLLSDNETWGLVITEAKILGIPCIVTDFAAAYEQIQDGTTGLILKRNCEEQGYNEIARLIVNNKQIYKNNLKNFEYDNKDIVNKWKEILV